MDHCKRFHPEISLYSIERYMAVGEIPIDELPALLDKTPSQAYRMVLPAKKSPSLPNDPVKSKSLKANSAQMRKFEDVLSLPGSLECPHCKRRINVSRAGAYLMVWRDQNTQQ